MPKIGLRLTCRCSCSNLLFLDTDIYILQRKTRSSASDSVCQVFLPSVSLPGRKRSCFLKLNVLLALCICFRPQAMRWGRKVGTYSGFGQELASRPGFPEKESALATLICRKKNVLFVLVFSVALQSFRYGVNFFEIDVSFLWSGGWYQTSTVLTTQIYHRIFAIDFSTQFVSQKHRSPVVCLIQVWRKEISISHKQSQDLGDKAGPCPKMLKNLTLTVWIWIWQLPHSKFTFAPALLESVQW